MLATLVGLSLLLALVGGIATLVGCLLGRRRRARQARRHPAAGRRPGADPPGPPVGGRVAAARPDPRARLPGPVDPPAPLPHSRVRRRRPGRHRHRRRHRRCRPGRLPAGRRLPGRHLGLCQRPGRATRAGADPAARAAPRSAAAAGPGRPVRHGPGVPGLLVAGLGRGQHPGLRPPGRGLGHRGRRAGRVRQDHARRPPPRPARPLPSGAVRADRRQGRPRLRPAVPEGLAVGQGRPGPGPRRAAAGASPDGRPPGAAIAQVLGVTDAWHLGPVPELAAGGRGDR